MHSGRFALLLAGLVTPCAIAVAQDPGDRTFTALGGGAAVW